MAGEQATDGNVLIDIGPMDTFAAANQAPVGTLAIGGVTQAGKPFDRHGKFPAVIQRDTQDRGGDRDINGEWFSPQN